MHNLKYFSLFLLISIFFISCEKDDTSVIDPTLTFPRIDSAWVSPVTFDSSRIRINLFANVTSEEEIRDVTAKIIDPNSAEVRTAALTFNGTNYSTLVDTAFSCRLVGLYRVEFIATNISGLPGNTFTVNFNVINSGNQPPFVSGLIIPDSLQRPAAGLNVTFLQVMATDPDGQCDVKLAFFNSFKPDGSPSSGNPFTMYDDGDIQNHCDSTANDSKYSLCIAIDPTAQLGYYKFFFNARDRSDSLSNTLLDSIYVYQP